MFRNIGTDLTNKWIFKLNTINQILNQGYISSRFISTTCTSNNVYKTVKRRTTYPFRWWTPKNIGRTDQLSPKNKEFMQQVVEEKAKNPSPLISTEWEKGVWSPGTIRTGVIARKLGTMPMWTKKGLKILTTLLQVNDCHVIKYHSPEETQDTGIFQMKGRTKGFGTIVVGAESCDPQDLTSAYCGLFNEAGVLPKKKISKFLCSDNAKLPPGTPLYATHFKVGDFVDVYGKTIDRDYQGVIQRWKFGGGPATHGATKFHRRTGSISCGRKNAIHKGKKMPGHMGEERRTMIGLKIWRINTKYNIIFVQGVGVPGPNGSFCYIFDSKTEKKRLTERSPPHFPTFFQDDLTEPMFEEMYHPDLHIFDEPTIVFEDLPQEKIKRTGAKLAKVKGKK